MLKVRITLTVVREVEVSKEYYGENEEITLPAVERIERESYMADPHMFFDSMINAEGMEESVKVELCAPS